MGAALLRSAPHFVDEQQTYQGLPGLGVPNLTARTEPPGWPMPEEEQGAGRQPGQQWEHRRHNVTVNPSWYLDQPYLGDVSLQEGPVPAAQLNPLPIAFSLFIYESEVRERQQGPGTFGEDASVVVPQPPSYDQGQLRVLARG